MYWFTGISGLLLAISPYVLGFTDNTAAFWTSLVVGGAILVASLFEAAETDKDPIEYWFLGALGIVAIAAPFVLNFTGITEALWMNIVVGGLVLVGAAGKLMVTRQPSYG
jgi:hypothetical protein